MAKAVPLFFMKRDQREYDLERNRSLVGKIKVNYQNQRKSSKKRGHPEPDYTKDELIAWALDQPIYHYLHELWVESGYDRNHSPSFDRLNDDEPYTLSNIRITTNRANYLKQSHRVRDQVAKTKRYTPVQQWSYDGTQLIEEFTSCSDATKAVGLKRSQAQQIAFAARNGHRCKGFYWKQG